MPEDEVEWVALAGIVGVAASFGRVLHHGRFVVARYCAEGVKGGHVEEDRCVDHIGVSLRLQRLDNLDHLGHPIRGVRFGEDRAGVEGDHVAVESSGLFGGEFEEVNTEFSGLGQDGIVDVGDVAHQLHLMAEVLKPADQEVVGEIGVRVAEMGGVVRGDTADVHLHLVSRFERDDLPPGRVEELHVGHGSHLR